MQLEPKFHGILPRIRRANQVIKIWRVKGRRRWLLPFIHRWHGSGVAAEKRRARDVGHIGRPASMPAWIRQRRAASMKRFLILTAFALVLPAYGTAGVLTFYPQPAMADGCSGPNC